MMRLTSVAAAVLVVFAPATLAQSSSELSLSHLSGEQETGTSTLLASPAEIRVKAVGRSKDGVADTQVVAILQWSDAGFFRRYDRETKSTKDGAALSTISVVVEDSAVRFRETGPMGSRTRTVTGPGLDCVVDGACPEILIPFLLDAGRKSLRLLMLPDVEVKDVMIEERDGVGRFAPLPGGGITLFVDAAGQFKKLALPGPGERTIVRSGSPDSRPAPPKGRETPIALTLDGGVKLALTLSLPAEGTGPYPGVLLLGDAGRRDRNGVGGDSLAPTLRLLADALAESGVATVRADKRGAGQSVGPDPDLGALVSDAKSLLEVLQLHPSIDRDRVFIAGHGEGAVVAAALAAQAGAASRESVGLRIAGVITLGGPARPLAEALEARLRVRLAAQGQLAESIEGTVTAFRSEIETLRNLPESAPTRSGQGLLRDLVKIDPGLQLAKIAEPLLVIHAGDDREVPSPQVAMLRASLAFSGLDRARFEIVDGADHDLLVSPKSAAMTGAARDPSDFARELHPRIPALIRDFVTRAPPSRPSGK